MRWPFCAWKRRHHTLKPDNDRSRERVSCELGKVAVRVPVLRVDAEKGFGRVAGLEAGPQEAMQLRRAPRRRHFGDPNAPPLAEPSGAIGRRRGRRGRRDAWSMPILDLSLEPLQEKLKVLAHEVLHVRRGCRGVGGSGGSGGGVSSGGSARRRRLASVSGGVARPLCVRRRIGRGNHGGPRLVIFEPSGDDAELTSGLLLLKLARRIAHRIPGLLEAQALQGVNVSHALAGTDWPDALQPAKVFRPQDCPCESPRHGRRPRST